jgi:hypothetical protein
LRAQGSAIEIGCFLPHADGGIYRIRQGDSEDKARLLASVSSFPLEFLSGA